MGGNPPPGFGASPPFLPPQRGAAAVQSEEFVQSPVADARASGTVFLGVFGESVEQAPPRRFGELLVAGVLELPEDRHDVAAVDGSDLGSFHDGRPSFVGTDLVKLQILGDGFEVKEFQLQFIDGSQDQIAQFDTAGMTTLQDHRSAEGEVAAAHHADARRETDRKALVVAVADADAAAPLTRTAVKSASSTPSALASQETAVMFRCEKSMRLKATTARFSDFFSAALAFGRDLGYNIIL